MVTASHPPPKWHPDELVFLQQHKVLDASTSIADLTRVKKRWIHNTLREVFLTPNGFVLKRYSHYPGRKDYRKIWKREHRALCRLSDMKVPVSLDYITVRHRLGVTSALHVRSLLRGIPASWNSDDDTKKLAEFMADIHRHYVVTLDPQLENFIALDGPGRQISFIDFGRARVFSGRNPLMLLNVGKDLAKLRLEGGLDQLQFQVFIQHYYHCIHFNSMQKTIIDFSFTYWLSRHARKHNR